MIVLREGIAERPSSILIKRDKLRINKIKITL